MIPTEERRFQSFCVNLDSDHTEPAEEPDENEHGTIHLLSTGVLRKYSYEYSAAVLRRWAYFSNTWRGTYTVRIADHVQLLCRTAVRVVQVP